MGRSVIYGERNARFFALFSGGAPRAEIRRELDLSSGQYDSLRARALKKGIATCS